MRLRWFWVGALLAFACGDSGTGPPPQKTPEWLAPLIARLEAAPVANPPALIAQFRYQGATVYYLPPRCGDIPSDLFDSSGDLLCHPDGGISGAGDGRCPDFFEQARYEREVWRDDRPRP